MSVSKIVGLAFAGFAFAASIVTLSSADSSGLLLDLNRDIPAWSVVVVAWATVLVGVAVTIFVSRRPRGGKGIEFYKNREELSVARGSFREEIERCDTIWAAWYTGINAVGQEVFASKRFHRLLLPNPDGPFLESLATMVGTRIDRLKSDIYATTTIAQNAGAEVHWSDRAIVNMMLGDPDTKDAWVRVDTLVPSAQERPSFLVKNASSPEFLMTLRRIYEDQWRASYPAPVEPI